MTGATRKAVICTVADRPGATRCCTIRVWNDAGGAVDVPLTLDAAILLMQQVTAAVLRAMRQALRAARS